MNKEQTDQALRKARNIQQRKKYYAILFFVLFIFFPAIVFWVLGTTDASMKKIPFWGISIAMPSWIVALGILWFLLYKLDLVDARSLAFTIPVGIAFAGIIWSYPLPLWARGVIALSCVLSTILFLFLSTRLEERTFQKNFDSIKPGRVR
ncbi:MAG3450 family membrane protein [Mycoplasma crocodyli]|uniref:Uncharacterized protein n=1 Tax=Mycoplasma crocodyli (strain ATCC 51981 / MP145) TaxID=512564 RepID=D5E5H3_MYCCM|nr:hypothetical protein [Mycoplasma crocodyli]ADE19964.1 hypothetical protein MCRO_0381 [Mycoplasma crocodyli MP145]